MTPKNPDTPPLRLADRLPDQNQAHQLWHEHQANRLEKQTYARSSRFRAAMHSGSGDPDTDG